MKNKKTSQSRANKARLKNERKKTRRRRSSIASYSRPPKMLRQSPFIRCPPVLSLSDNFNATMEFFHKIKQLAKYAHNGDEPSHQVVSRYSLSFNQVEHISVRCALIAVAEIDRLQRIAGAPLKNQPLTGMDHEPLAILTQMGCFDLLELTDNLPNAVHTSAHRAAIPIVTGTNCGDLNHKEFIASVRRICADYTGLKQVQEALIEAILNVNHHAYIDQLRLKYPIPDKRWWAAATFDNKKREMRFMVYDQGHGISATAPATGFKRRLEEALPEGSFINFQDEVAVIRAALTLKVSRTNLAGRGQGFGDIKKPIKLLEGSRLTIASGRAKVTLRAERAIEFRALKHHIGGTLVEWVFPTEPLRRFGVS